MGSNLFWPQDTTSWNPFRRSILIDRKLWLTRSKNSFVVSDKGCISTEVLHFYFTLQWVEIITGRNFLIARHVQHMFNSIRKQDNCEGLCKDSIEQKVCDKGSITAVYSRFTLQWDRVDINSKTLFWLHAMTKRSLKDCFFWKTLRTVKGNKSVTKAVLKPRIYKGRIDGDSYYTM